MTETRAYMKGRLDERAFSDAAEESMALCKSCAKFYGKPKCKETLANPEEHRMSCELYEFHDSLEGQAGLAIDSVTKALFNYYINAPENMPKQDALFHVLRIIDTACPVDTEIVNGKFIVTCENAGAFIGPISGKRWDYVSEYVKHVTGLTLAVRQERSQVYKHFHNIEGYIWSEDMEETFNEIPSDWYDSLLIHKEA